MCKWLLLFGFFTGITTVNAGALHQKMIVGKVVGIKKEQLLISYQDKKNQQKTLSVPLKNVPAKANLIPGKSFLWIDAKNRSVSL